MSAEGQKFGPANAANVAALQARVAALETRLAEALQENGRLALEAATADQDWKKAEARLAEAEGALRAAADVIDVALGADAHYLKNFPRTERHHAKRVLAAARAALPSESGTP